MGLPSTVYVLYAKVRDCSRSYRIN